MFKAWIEATSNTAAPNYAVEASAGRNCPDSKVTVTVGAHISLRINADTTTIADYGTFTGLNPNGNQVTFDGRLKPFTFRIVAGKQNGMAKGTAPLTAGSRVRVNFNLKSDVVDDPNGTESALWAIKTRGRDSTDALGHAVSEFPGLEKYYTTTDPGLGSVSSVSSSGGTYSFDITGFTGRNPGDTVSEGILVCSQRMPLSGPSTYHYNTTVTCSTALITANDGHGERTLSLEYPTGSGIYPAASHSNAVTEPGSYNTTIHLSDVVEDENGKRPLLSAGETSTANAIGYGKEFYVTAAHTNILYSAENKIKSYNQYILWDNNKVDLVVNNNGVYDTTIFSMSGWTKYYYEEDYPIRFITKKDGTTWTSDEEMTTANLKNFDDLRFYKNYSSVPYGWKLCGILVEGRYLRDEVLGTDNIHGIIFRMKTVDNQANVNQVAMFTQSVDAYREEKGNITRASSNGMGIVMVDGDRVSRYMGNRTYTKTRWNEDGTIDSSSLTAHNIVYEGTSLLIKGFTCLVDIKHMDGTESKTLDLGTARNIEFRVQPKLYSKDLNTVAKSTELLVTVPEGLEVAAVSAGNRHESVMFGRNHETSRYAEGNSGTFKVTKESGKVRVVFTNAVSDKELPEFFIKYNFVPGYLKNGSTVTIDAQYTGDSRAVNKVAGNEATASFRIVETEASVLKETVDKKEVKNGEKLTYTMTYLNRSGENTPLSLTSVKPVNGDAAGTQLSGGGTLKFVSVTAEASRGSAINASSTANGIKATGTVLPGEEVIVTAVYEVKDAVEGDMIRNFCQQEDENGTIVSNSVETTVLQQRGDISFVKAVKDSLWPLPGVSFRITSVKTGESAVVNTGSDGSYSSATITSDRIWFGSQRSDNSSGALPYGKYRIQELSTGIASRSTELIDMTIELNDSTVNKNTGLYDLGTLTNAFVLEIKKAVDRVSNDLGEKHTWTVEASVPAGISADRGSCSYELVDPLDSRLKYEGNVTVSTVNGTVVSTMVSGTDYTLAEPQTSSGGTLSVRMTTAGIKKLESVEAVRLTFMTSINSSAQAGVNIPNQATLNYSGFGYRQTLHSNEPYVYTGRIAVSKKDAETGRPMQDVTFQLLRIGEGGSETTFERDGSPLTAVTNSSGEAVFFGLKDGNYKVVEVSTRAGYTLLPEGIQAEIEQGQSEVINMTNQEGVHLSAGGEGIASMYQRGLFLIAVSLLASKKNLFVRRKQKISTR